jgi:O-acetyl-ADP-ribose deacetylase (regulator of RNase III)
VTIVNMLAQKGIGPNLYGMAPIRYEALRECLYNLFDVAEEGGYPIRAPKFGAGLAGGNWSEIELIIQDVFGGTNVPFTVYSL